MSAPPASERRPKQTPRIDPRSELMGLVTIARGLKLEAKGIVLTAKAPKCTTIARRRLGLRGNRESLYRQVMELIEKRRQELGVSREEVASLVV